MIDSKCPRCDLPLHAQTSKGVARRACANCMGFVTQSGSLRSLLKPEDLRRLLATADSASLGKAGCPSCRNEMKILFAGPRPVEIDFCEKCDLIWFDIGEWKDISRSFGTSEASDENLQEARVRAKFLKQNARSVRVREDDDLTDWIPSSRDSYGSPEADLLVDILDVVVDLVDWD